MHKKPIKRLKPLDSVQDQILTYRDRKIFVKHLGNKIFMKSVFNEKVESNAAVFLRIFYCMVGCRMVDYNCARVLSPIIDSRSA